MFPRVPILFPSIADPVVFLHSSSRVMFAVKISHRFFFPISALHSFYLPDAADNSYVSRKIFGYKTQKFIQFLRGRNVYLEESKKIPGLVSIENVSNL